MRKLLIATAILALISGAAFAGGEHGGGHGNDVKKEEGQGHAGGTDGANHHDDMAIGKTGDEAAISKTINIVMLEKDDGSMVFEPASIDVKKGETVRLSFTNKGDAEHEFVMDQHQAILDHKVAMEKWPNMEHADPNAIRLESGASGEIIWAFSNNGAFEFACLIPGHYEAGMRGDLTVSAEVTLN